MSATAQSFTISPDILSRFAPSVRQTIIDVVQLELEKARNNCLRALALSTHDLRGGAKRRSTEAAVLEATWQHEASLFVASIENFLTNRVGLKRGPNIKSDAKQVLEEAFARSQFLNKAECRLIANATGLSSQQVRTWFQNRRNRLAKPGQRSRSDRKTATTSPQKTRGTSASTQTRSPGTRTCTPPLPNSPAGGGSSQGDICSSQANESDDGRVKLPAPAVSTCSPWVLTQAIQPTGESAGHAECDGTTRTVSNARNRDTIPWADKEGNYCPVTKGLGCPSFVNQCAQTTFGLSEHPWHPHFPTTALWPGAHAASGWISDNTRTAYMTHFPQART